MSVPKKLPHWADGLWLALLALYIVAGAAIAPFHGDESTLIFMGRDYHHLFVEHDLSSVLYDDTWARRPDEQHLRLLNGTISKTIYGWLAWTRGYKLDDFNGQWNWGIDFQANVAEGRAPDQQLLTSARLASALQLALAVAIFFGFARLVFERPLAYLASLLLMMQPNLLINGRRAMMEGSHLLGLMLVLLAAAWLIRERAWWKYLLLGAAMGFAVAAKHPNAIVCALVMLTICIETSRRILDKDWSGRREEFAGILSIALVAILSFLLLNPAWWASPAAMPSLIVELRADLLAGQVGWLGGYESFGEQVSGFFRFVFANERQYYEVPHWAGYSLITEQISAYEVSGLAGLLAMDSQLAGIFALLLSGGGVYALLRKRMRAGMRALLLIWIVGSALFTLMITPLPWARYYLPLLPAQTLLVALALHWLAVIARARFTLGSDGISLLA